ncbi:CRISPR-associated protein Csx16 [Methylocaldum szegediense]|uniref:CRISPR-associated protein Csx16 n=1 Tax=Methylocaldum szegediense TaxID=73780 RepID=A0ABM9HYH4_9GAMM|nr:CRISPR-associated protein Csx16 [Methylocaldum szegediense]CAI8770930.1 CRISPR-associated protein Csx16 [Methylocaldum szegediense]
MTTYFVTRHPGAVDWARESGISVDRQLAHLDIAEVKSGDWVIGTLPVHLAAEVCALGARYFHLALEIPPGWRGRELSAEDLRRFGARIVEYRVVEAGKETP